MSIRLQIWSDDEALSRNYDTIDSGRPLHQSQKRREPRQTAGIVAGGLRLARTATGTNIRYQVITKLLYCPVRPLSTPPTVRSLRGIPPALEGT